MKILFVCTGNTCRSPMAEYILRKKVKENKLNLEIKSAGISAIEGYSASKNAIEVINNYGMKINHKTKRISKELINWADLILTMTTIHKQIIQEQYPEIIDKLYTLKEYSSLDNDVINENTNNEINDPFGGSIEDYNIVAREIEEAIDKIIFRDFLKRN